MKKIDWHATALVVVLVAFVAFGAFMIWVVYDHYQLSRTRVHHCGKINGKFVISDHRGLPSYYIQVGMRNYKVDCTVYNTAVVGSTEACLTLNGLNEVQSVSF